MIPARPSGSSEPWTFRVYGLRLASEIELELPLRGEPRTGVAPDVRVVRVARSDPPWVPALPAGASGDQGWFLARGNEGLFHWPDFALVRVIEGRRIEVDAAPGAEARQLEAALLGPVASVLLLQRGLLPLHAAVVEVDGTAVAVAGASGAGKSTLAAALCARGHAFLSDDVAAVRLGRGRPRVYGAYPALKLGRASSEALGRVGDEGPLVNPDEGKRLVSPGAGFAPGPLRLGRLYVLEDAAGLAIEPLSVREAHLELLRHAHRAPLLHGVAGTPEVMRRSAAVAERVPAFRLRRPRAGLAPERLDELVRAIEGHRVPEGVP